MGQRCWEGAAGGGERGGHWLWLDVVAQKNPCAPTPVLPCTLITPSWTNSGHREVWSGDAQWYGGHAGDMVISPHPRHAAS